MGQKENKRQLLQLLSVIKGSPQSLKQVTSQWVIDPNVALIHDTELSGKVVSGNTISLNDYYPLVQYPNGDHLVPKSRAKA
jgi:hypothetical protein